MSLTREFKRAKGPTVVGDAFSSDLASTFTLTWDDELTLECTCAEFEEYVVDLESERDAALLRAFARYTRQGVALQVLTDAADAAFCVKLQHSTVATFLACGLFRKSAHWSTVDVQDVASVAELCGAAFDGVGDRDDALLLGVMQQCLGCDEARLLATYFAVVWKDVPWLHFLRPESTRCAAVASTTKIDQIDDVARASVVMSFVFERAAAGEVLQDASDVMAAATPGATTPCLFAFAGTPSDFDLLFVHFDFASRLVLVRRLNVVPKSIDAVSLLRPIHEVVRHVVRSHNLAQRTAASSATAVWRLPTPLTIPSTLSLPDAIAATSTVLARVLKLFPGAEAPVFSGDCSLKFCAVVAATERRFLCRVQVGNSELVLKYAWMPTSAQRERDRVAHVCAAFAGDDELRALRHRVRLPLGAIAVDWPVLVSDVWPGRSLNVGRPANNAARAKVRALLEQQIWPVIDALAAKNIFYSDLHAGNVMVDDALDNAWLIDFEGAISPPSIDELHATIATQKTALLALFSDE